LGTFDYISPEQARDPRNADLRSDIYSLGCTLFYMLTGGPPFPQGTVLQKLLQHQGIEPPDVRQFRPHVPEEVSRVLRKMMAKEPRHRYPDASRLINALRSLAEQIGLRLLGPGHTKWIALEEAKRSFLRRHVPWMGPVAALLVIVALLQTLWAGPAQDDGQLPSWGDPLEKSVEQPLASEVPPVSTEGVPGPERLDDARPLEPPAESPDQGPPTVPTARPDDVALPTEKPGPAGPNGGAAEGLALPQGKTAVEGPAAEPLPSMTAKPSDDGLIGPETPQGSPAQPDQSETTPDAKPQAELDRQGTNKTLAATPKTPGADPAGQSVSKTAGILVVDPSGESQEAFATLAEACKLARSGDVIELQFNGPSDSQPITLADVELTLRAAPGFRPVLRFGPSEIDPASSPRSMLTLVRSRLTLFDVAIELDIPRGVPSESWALFEVGPGQEVKLAGCWLTIRNASGQRMAYHQQVAFFRVTPPGAQPGLQKTPVAGAPILAIQLADCVVRGEAVFLHTAGPGPVDLVWTNGLLVTTEQLLVASGIEEPAQANDVIRINLKHLAAVVDGGLCRWVSSEMGPHQLAARIDCANSVILGTAKASLIEQVGVTDNEQSLERIQWVGNRNTYEGFTGFWTTRYLDPETPPEVRDFDAWRIWWGEQNEIAPTMRLIGGSPRPGPERPAHSLTPNDYAWAAATAGQEPIAEGAAGAQQSGFQGGRLPMPPAEPVTDGMPPPPP
jgi:serine/threonine-protein kinase